MLKFQIQKVIKVKVMQALKLIAINELLDYIQIKNIKENKKLKKKLKIEFFLKILKLILNMLEDIFKLKIIFIIN